MSASWLCISAAVRESRATHDHAQTLSMPELHSRAAAGDIDGVVTELARGVMVNERDLGGCTALHWAARKGRIQIARLLVARGADLTVKNTRGETPVEVAEGANQLEVADLLRDSRRRTRQLVTDREAEYGRARIDYAVDQARAAYEQSLRAEAEWAAQVARQRRLARKRQNQLYRDQLDRTAVQWIAAAQPPKEFRQQNATPIHGRRRGGAGPAMIDAGAGRGAETPRNDRRWPTDLYRPAEPGWGPAYAVLNGTDSASPSSYRPPDLAVSLPRAPPGYAAPSHDLHGSIVTPHEQWVDGEPPGRSRSTPSRSNHARRGRMKQSRFPQEAYYV